MSESDEESPQLSAHALAALQEFYKEKLEEEKQLTEAQSSGCVDNFTPTEDWQLSQFWYDNHTALTLAKEALSVVGEKGRIACVSSPTAYKKIRELKPDTVTAKCLEFDKRFGMYGEDFVFYDYNQPTDLEATLQDSFDLVIADPPFLSEECLSKTAQTVKFLTSKKIILCTGAVMADLALQLLGVKPCSFKPSHTHGLQNEFMCFANYQSQGLNS